MKRPAVVIACGALIVTLAMGVRQTFGLFLPDMSAALDIGRGTFGLALAIQNLLFGLAQPFVGAIADRHGAGRVVAFGAILYALGLIGAAMASSAFSLHITFGVIVGMAQSATTFVVVPPHAKRPALTGGPFCWHVAWTSRECRKPEWRAIFPMGI